MIEAVNLTKRFDDIVAVDHINAQIRDGRQEHIFADDGRGVKARRGDGYH